MNCEKPLNDSIVITDQGEKNYVTGNFAANLESSAGKRF